MPVLSSTMVSNLRVSSKTSGPRIRMPSWAPRPVPTISPIGVAKPSAQGQAITKTATAAVKAASMSLLNSHQARNVTTAMISTIGTNTEEIRSARRAIGALPDCASETSRPIWAKVVSEPTRVVSMTSRPEVLTVAPVTSSPSPTRCGTDSPVSSEVSIALAPWRTIPSVAIFSPGRTTK